MSNSRCISNASAPMNMPILCIPRVCSNMNDTRIRRIFEELNIGILDRIDIINKNSDKTTIDIGPALKTPETISVVQSIPRMRKSTS